LREKKLRPAKNNSEKSSKTNSGQKSISPMKGKAHIYFFLNFQKNMFSQNAEQPNLLRPIQNLETEQISSQPTKLNKNLMNKMLNLIIKYQHCITIIYPVGKIMNSE